MSREPYPEVPVPRPFPRARLRSTAAVFTTMSALAATSLGAGPSAAGLDSAAPCALTRTDAHHSEGLDTWNAAYPRPARSLDAVMVFLSFPDAHPLTTPQELTADHFPATTRFFERASYGRFTLRPHTLRHWIQMPKPSTAYAIQRDWKPEHRSAYLRDALSVADPRVDFSRYDVVYFVADPDAPGVDSDATKVVNLTSPLRADGTDLRRIVTVFEQHPPDRLVLAHETGHVFDLPDLYHRPADGKGDWDTHVGDWDLMGSQFGLAPDLFAWHKWKLGWLDPRQVRCVQDAGPARLTLEPLAAGAAMPTTGAAGAQPFGLGRGTKLAVVRTGPDSVLALEVRGPVGNDVAACRQGVLVYRVRGGAQSGGGPIEVIDAHPRTDACWEDSVYPPLADAPIGIGESFTVPGEGVRVEVEGRTASGAWTVKIAVGR
ncbi:M6 family metalloprotease domain-containing protein [Streptomyces sp. NEAU-H22]|uniref:M6 family metalloprotease domain-containing protein n=1 Tax=unclassified Streptomyces TaxID=2593676 RepID=UPI002253B1F8|nr:MULTISPECIES: M6 family metalloprotease domain-containing protein [unclassified Streptomyces]MCX3286092.1 M6 family metalloprotease domain-containing protein [Streptomyces sp. NEAU-H22]WMD08942.1 M6 family metalloprotease domain-containing protein [Streptomyces sp. FXY-T5]